MNASSSIPTSLRPAKYPGLIVVALVLLAVTAVFTRDMTAGGFCWGDAPSHAMDGVLIHDWVAAGPTAWRYPMAFAEKQYSFYPTLSIGGTYPPGFAVFEASLFQLFGVSVGTQVLSPIRVGQKGRQ